MKKLLVALMLSIVSLTSGCAMYAGVIVGAAAGAIISKAEIDSQKEVVWNYQDSYYLLPDKGNKDTLENALSRATTKEQIKNLKHQLLQHCSYHEFMFPRQEDVVDMDFYGRELQKILDRESVLINH